MSENKINFEAQLASLEKVIEKLEKGECTLEESIELFEQGMQNVKACRQALKDAEFKLTNLGDFNAQ